MSPCRTHLRDLCLTLLIAGGLWGLFPGAVRGQEFMCSVSVNYSNLTGSDYSFLQELRQEIFDYINHRSWTTDRFQDFERIECTIQVFMTEALSLSSFKSRLVIAMRRPIYGTTETTTVVQFNDEDWRFDYTRGTPLIFDIDRFDALTSVLDFYAYVMLGYDYDTFSEFGGTPYFEQARLIAELARSSGAAGWTQLGGDQSRGELIAQLMDPRFRSLRKIYFNYHYGGLDHFVQDNAAARGTVMTALQELRALTEEVSRAYVIDLFFSTKFKELAAIFKGSPYSGQAYEILTVVDPPHLTDYNDMVQ